MWSLNFKNFPHQHYTVQHMKWGDIRYGRQDILIFCSVETRLKKFLNVNHAVKIAKCYNFFFLLGPEMKKER